MFRLAVGVTHAASTSSSKLPSLAEAKQAFRHAAPDQRAVKAQERRSLRRKRARERNRVKLQKLSAGRRRKSDITALEIDGSLSTDRQQWIKAAEEYVSAKFSDEHNIADMQRLRLTAFKSAHDADKLDGLGGACIELFDVLQGRAHLKGFKEAGYDGCTAEVWKAIPFITVVHVWALFQDRASLKACDESPFLRILMFAGIPKTRFVTRFSDLRWIAKTPVLQKWYMRSLRPQYLREVSTSPVHSYGFKIGFRTEDIGQLIKELLVNHDRWRDHPSLFVGSQDLATAFDKMQHAVVAHSLKRRGISNGTIARILQELYDLQGILTVPGAGDTKPFPYTLGCKQGAVETT